MYLILYLVVGFILTLILWIMPYCAAWYRVKNYRAGRLESIPKTNNKITVPWVRDRLEDFSLEDEEANVWAMVAASLFGPFIILIVIIGIFPYRGVVKVIKSINEKGGPLVERIVKNFALTKEEKAQIALGTIKTEKDRRQY